MSEAVKTPPQAGPSLKRVQVLSDLSASQIKTIRNIPSHEDAAPKAIDERRPTSIFLDPARLEQEQAQIFRKLAVPVTVSAAIPTPGTVMAHDHYGISLLLARGLDGEVRTFLNTCTHKGSKLVEDSEPHRAKKVTCPYHAWTFALDGNLVAVPREETISNFKKCDRGLKQVACREEGGLIWVMIDPKADPDFSSLDADFTADMEAFDLPNMHLYGRKIFNLKANWKLVLEPFLEGYHVQRLHARSVGPMFADVPTITEELGRNIRQISGKMNFTPDCLDIPGENIHKSVTHAYQVFPNTVIVTSPYYISVMVIIPTDVDKTTVDYMMLTRGPADNEKAEELYKKSYKMILNVFGGEDFRAAEITQTGLKTGGLDDVIYCGLEENIPRYYRILENLL